jgi:hypothetical protein
MSDFARLVSKQCPPQEALAFGLAEELDAAASETARRSLDVLARGLTHPGEPTAELEDLRVLAHERLRPREDGALLLPDILAQHAGHPAGIAIVLAALAERADYRIGLVGHGQRLYLAHREMPPLRILDPSRPERLLDPRTLGVDLSWRCAHEAAGVVLRHLSVASERSGDLTRSLGASALLLALPVDDAARAAQTAVHQRLLSRLN